MRMISRAVFVRGAAFLFVREVDDADRIAILNQTVREQSNLGPDTARRVAVDWIT